MKLRLHFEQPDKEEQQNSWNAKGVAVTETRRLFDAVRISGQIDPNELTRGESSTTAAMRSDMCSLTRFCRGRD